MIADADNDENIHSVPIMLSVLTVALPSDFFCRTSPKERGPWQQLKPGRSCWRATRTETEKLAGKVRWSGRRRETWKPRSCWSVIRLSESEENRFIKLLVIKSKSPLILLLFILKLIRSHGLLHTYNIVCFSFKEYEGIYSYCVFAALIDAKIVCFYLMENRKYQK